MSVIRVFRGGRQELGGIKGQLFIFLEVLET